MNFNVIIHNLIKALKYFTFVVIVCLPGVLSAQTLIGSWQFNGNANDASGNNLNGTVYNATLTAGKDGTPNTAYLFNGYSSHIDVPYSALLNLTKFTMEVVLRVDGFNSADCQTEYMICRGLQFTSNYYAFGFNDNEYDNSCYGYNPSFNQFFSGVAGTSVNTLSPSTDYIQTGVWYDVVATYDGNIIKHYINGALIDSQLFISQFNYTGTTPILSFGYSPLGGTTFPYWFNGAIDRIAIWDNALDSVAVNNNYNDVDTISINQPFTDTTMCAGTSHQLNYTVNVPGVFQPGNTFTVQLSDPYGDFINPVNIGSVTSTVSGTIPYTIPFYTFGGGGYRIRIISSNPQIISEDDQHNMVIFPSGTPTVGITVNNNNGSVFCAGTPVTFKATFGFMYASGPFSIQYQWKKNGVNVGINDSLYTDATLISTDVITCVVTTIGGCLVPSTVTSNALSVTVLPVTAAPAVVVSASPAVPVCYGTPITFTVFCDTAYTYQWKKNGSVVPNYSGCVYTDSTLLPGAVVVCVATGNQSCMAPGISQPAGFIINPAPDTAVTNSGSIHVCEGDSIILNAAAGTGYQWQKNGVNITGATTGTYVVHATGNYTVFVTNNYGCSITSSTVPATVSALPSAPIANIGGYLQICTGDSLLLNTASYIQGYTYQWYWNGNTISGASGATYTAYTAGTYKVTVADYGCSNTSGNLSVTTIPSPIDTLLSYGNTVMCPGGAAITLSGGTAGDPESYLWFMNGQPIMSATSATYAAPATGAYRLKITDTDNGCSSFSKPVFITPGNIPEPVIAYQWPKFKTGAFSSYQWYYNGTLITGATLPTYTPKQSGVYAVVVKDVNGCSGTSANYYFAYSGVNNVSVTGSDIKIYPNPANDVVYIEAPVTVNATLYTIDGRLIQSGKGVKQFDISGLASGIYLITILDENNAIIKTDKLVKGL